MSKIKSYCLRFPTLLTRWVIGWASCCGRPYKYDSSQTEYFVETEAKVTIRKKELEAYRHVATQEAVAGQDSMMGDPFSLSIRSPSVASVRGRSSSLRLGYRLRALPGRLRLRLWT